MRMLPRPPAGSIVRAIACVSLGMLSAACQRGAAGVSEGAMTPSTAPAVVARSMEEAGEYLTIVGNCNDCHTQGWVERRGEVPASERLAGSNVGFRGGWGTTYGKNLRTVAQRVTEDRWVSILTTTDGGDGKPPMPWWNTAKTSDRDLRAMYRYIRSLGPRASPVPRSLPPGKEPASPWVLVDPAMHP